MTAILPNTTKKKIVYPAGDGAPVAETYDHLYALFVTLEVLRQYLQGQQATVLGNQFLYYAQGLPKLRVAPDVMVIFDVEPGGRDSYKVWEEGSVPAVVFEMTSKGTRQKDEVSKYELYEAMGVLEYWQFDPKAEWITEGLRGYRLENETYVPITDGISQVLGLRLAAAGTLIEFYDLKTEQKLLIPDEQRERADQEAQRADQAEAELRTLKAKLKAKGIELDD
ncbi:Uma2 family endonuclease [Leptolyngbya cf. ectocarpi LEGE 11479]|uniref:Uma2 family endonuclease n=1 Tax=Leptolyngbya cf. ectocarpi LEGE 11479 TaxID=1828722 RepID=A0A929F970_LEPEC|nr:Uma2 family endonuclease [Leptolyngbya ectocarpi]MBE9069201.1 Uma2 family endonuclease [Leptolyngbya cf. ectocarpi LEGE 11479]